MTTSLGMHKIVNGSGFGPLDQATTAKIIFDDLIETFSDPAKFTHGRYAVNMFGEDTNCRSESAIAWCSIGRTDYARTNYRLWFNLTELVDLIMSYIRRTSKYKELNVMYHNDPLQKHRVFKKDLELATMNDHYGRDAILQVLQQARALVP